MKKYYLSLFLLIGLLSPSLSYSDGMIITFEEECEDIIAQNESVIDEAEQEKPAEEPISPSEEETVPEKAPASPSKTDAEPPKMPSKAVDPKDSLEPQPPVLEKKDFLPDHKESAPVDSYEKTFMQTLLVLIGLLLLVFFGIWFVRKFSGGRIRQHNMGKTIKVLERRPLSHKSMLYLVDIRGRQFLIAESQLEVRPISSLDWLDEEKEI